MTEKEIQLLGFEKHVEEDTEHPFYYYTLDIVTGLSFISNSSDEVKEDAFGWYIELFDTEPSIIYTNFGDAMGLINNLTRHIVK
jgi:hypothetical protein